MGQSIESAILLNNQGVALLLSDNDVDAVDALTQSVKLMKQELLKLSNGENTTASRNIAYSTVEFPGMDDGKNYIFSQAIALSQVLEFIPNECDIRIYSAVVIYNLALGQHAVGKRGDEVCLVKAEKLYAMVLKLLEDPSCKNRMSVVVKLASINNLSQLRFERGDFELAREGLAHVSRFLRTSQASGPFMDEPEIQILLMNVLLLKAPKIAPAA
jgi:hypothetical protein